MNKNFILSLLYVFFFSTPLKAQQVFGSEGDVYLYLSTNIFKNNEVDISISFTGMGAYLHSNGRMVGINPEISILDSKSVIIKYYLIDNYSKPLTFLLKGNTESLVDMANKRVYQRLDLYSEDVELKSSPIPSAKIANSRPTNQNDLYNKSWAESQAKKEAEEILERNNAVLNSIAGYWSDNESENFVLIEKEKSLWGVDEFDIYLFLEYSKGNHISRKIHFDFFDTDPNVETEYFGVNMDGEHIFNNQLIVNKGNLKMAIFEDRSNKSFPPNRIDVFYGDFENSFTLEESESTLKKVSKFKSAYEAKIQRDYYGYVDVALSVNNGKAPGGSLYFKKDELVYVDLNDFNLKISHSNNSEAQFSYDASLDANGTFDIKFEPDNLNFVYKYSQETQNFEAAPISDFKNKSYTSIQQIMNFSIHITTKDHLGEIKENVEYIITDLIRIKDDYTEKSASNIIYPFSNADEINSNDTFSPEIKESILKAKFSKMEQHSLDYFTRHKWLKRGRQEVTVNVSGDYFIDSEGNVFLKELTTAFDSDSKKIDKLDFEDILEFNNYLIDKINSDSNNAKVIPAQYLIESLNGYGENDKPIIDSLKIPVNFSFKHEHTWKMTK